jgi:hypothetical protein
LTRIFLSPVGGDVTAAPVAASITAPSLLRNTALVLGSKLRRPSARAAMVAGACASPEAASAATAFSISSNLSVASAR